MPLRTKKWTKSKANQYISRSKACKKLQISLPSFRKLCILKGIYPHDPRKKHRKEGDKRVYYHVKDIKNLRREPILWQWRNQRRFRGQIIKHKGRHNWDKVKRMQLNLPQISIDHLVRERYPTFNDALRDLDDCVTFMFLFSTLPSGIIPQLTALRRIQCQKLCKEYRNYIIKHGLLRKAFISIKGIYYQCQFKNKYNVTWIVPHHFTHSIPDNVDYRVMSSFLDFYQTMFKFVVFKLYKNGHMKYPPFGHIDYDLTNLSLTSLINKDFTMKRKINCNKKNRMKKKMNDNDDEKKKKKVVELDLNKILKEKDINNNNDIDDGSNDNKMNNKYSRKEWDRSNLFQDFQFLLNRETPQFELEFVILSMGGTVIFEQECRTKKLRNAASITHEIIDRNISESNKLNTREYIQPQWIFDCLNVGAVLPTEHYQIGIQCPPHLSPFVNYNDSEHNKTSHKPSQQFVLEHWSKISKQFGGFVPSKKLKEVKELKELKEVNMIKIKEDDDDDKEEEITMNLDIADIMDMNEMDNELNDELNGFIDDDHDEEEENEEEDENEDEEEEEEEDEISLMQKKESILEKQRIKIANKERRKWGNKKTKHSLSMDGIPGNREESIKVNLARTMMSKKYRKTYDKIRRNKKKKSKHIKYMDEKRRKFEQKQMHTKH